jgi:hypothetical protein
LHAFQDPPFERAVIEAANRAELARGRIRSEGIDAVPDRERTPSSSRD